MMRPPEQDQVTVHLPAAAREYDIVIGEKILAQAGALIAARLGKRRCVIISDDQVAPLYQKQLQDSLAPATHQVLGAVIVPHGEASKNFAQLQKTLDALFAYGIDRKTLVIALGGGVVGDLAGCVASLALRGLDLVQVPTTLLAQVDSSVGGKNGINSQYGKNTIGAFYQPALVLIDTQTLATLPSRELRAGYAEVVKYGLIRDRAFFDWCTANASKLLAGDNLALRYAIAKSCEHKAQVVAADERESGMRALLNLGHTFGHALESICGYDSAVLLHGEAVAIGMVLAFQLSAALGLCSAQDAQSVRDHIAAAGLPVAPTKRAGGYDIDALMQLMAQDKKADAGKLTLILARSIGDAFVSHDVDADAVRKIWAQNI